MIWSALFKMMKYSSSSLFLNVIPLKMFSFHSKIVNDYV